VSVEPHGQPAPDRLPKAIGRYVIRERIGRGGMGVVYRAFDEKTNTEIALKVMASDLDGDPETSERFFREAHVAGRLRHRNLVTVLESGEDGGRLYIAMELLTGTTLAAALKDSSALDLEDRIDLMLQVCQGLSVAHAAGVYHRDLKPANLFMCDDRRVKILDFGVARLVGSNMTVTGNIIGTPDFMSPEQVRGQEIDGRSDIFSVGSVFYLLLTGRRPFAAKDLPAVLNKVVRAQPLPIRAEEAPDTVAAVIRKAMSKDPAARQQDVEELAWELMVASAALEATTRQTALNVRTMAEELIQLTTRRNDLSAALEVPQAEHDAWVALRDQYPVLQAGPQVLGTFPFRAALVKELDRVARNELDSLRPLVSTLEEGHAKLVAGQALQSGGALEQAAAEYAAAHRAVPSSPAITKAVESCAKAIDEQLERAAHLAARLTIADEAVARSDWAALLTIVNEIQDVDRENATAARLRALALWNLESERARAARTASRPDTTPKATPTPVSGTDEEDRIVRGEHLREEALRHFTAGDLAAAERLASQSVSVNGESNEARHLLERVRTTIRLRARDDENFGRVAELLQRANALADKDNFVEALSIVDEALSIDAGNVTAIALRARVVAQRSAQDAERVTEAARQRGVRIAAPSLRNAQRAFQEGDFERARWYAENALALAPESSEALGLLAQVAAALPAPDPDDTVKLDDPLADTVKVVQWRSSVQERITDFCAHASAWIGRWWSPGANTKDR
jgi:tetratricopeptide (TPR) repeat protein